MGDSVNVIHKDLAAGRWVMMPLVEQLANIGSEVERAMTWRNKGNPVYSEKAMERALDLLDLSLNAKLGFARLKELARLREALVDYFFCENEYGSSETSWNRYFGAFAYAARKNR